MEDYRLPDGRRPIRFGKGRTAYYAKLRGAGEVVYTFSMIKYMINNRPRLSEEALSTVAKNRAAELKKTDAEFFHKIGAKGGKSPRKKKDGSKNRQDSQR